MTTTANVVLSAEEMAECDRRAIGSGVSGLTLMENAGRAVANEATEMVPPGARIAVLCGPGNNGGDGYVAARLLRERGYDVAVYAWKPPAKPGSDAAVMAGRCSEPVLGFDAIDRSRGYDLRIDAVFGAGLTRAYDAETHRSILSGLAWFGQRDGRLGRTLAVDVPSGINASTGEVPSVAPPTERTVTFFRKKVGHLLDPGRVLCGEIRVHDIGIPEHVLPDRPQLFENAAPQAQAFDPHIPAASLASHGDVHKYARGHVAVLSGAAHATGAARLSARAALRAGAGLVTIIASDDAVPVIAAHETSVMVMPLGRIGDLKTWLKERKVTAAVVGPGAGISNHTMDVAEAAVSAGCRVVLDADALTSFAGDLERLLRLANDAAVSAPDAAARVPAVVLTPHEGEFRRLFPKLDGDKLKRARAAAAETGALVVLKGADTVIAMPDGLAAIDASAPATLATAGSGDVLAGIIAAMLARSHRHLWCDAFAAARTGVWLHGACARRFGLGLIAEDLPDLLPVVFDTLLAES